MGGEKTSTGYTYWRESCTDPTWTSPYCLTSLNTCGVASTILVVIHACILAYTVFLAGCIAIVGLILWFLRIRRRKTARQILALEGVEIAPPERGPGIVFANRGLKVVRKNEALRQSQDFRNCGGQIICESIIEVKADKFC
jgi:hypothetical protein